MPDGPECPACGIVVAKFRARRRVRPQDGTAPGNSAAAGALSPAGSRRRPGDRPPGPLDRVSQARLAAVFGQLASLLESGVALESTLRLFEQQSPRALGRAFSGVRRALNRGEGLAQALGEYPAVFGAEVAVLVDAGERSGSLPAVFAALAASCEARVGLRRRILRSLLFPFILFSLSFFLLPLGRLVSGGLGAYLAESLLPYLLTLAGGVVLVVMLPWLAGRLLGRRRVQALLDLLPVLGRLRRLRNRSVFCRQLAAGLRAGLEVGLAVDLAARVSSQVAISLRAERALELVRGGATLADAFRGARLLDEAVWLAVEAGELAGRLDEILERQARQDQEAFLVRLDVAVQLLAVLVLLAVYAFVAWRVIDQYRSLMDGYQGQLDKILQEAGGSGGALDSLLRGANPASHGVLPPELREILP